MTLTLRLPLRAAPQGSKRHVGNGRLVEMSGNALKAYRAGVALAAKQQTRGSVMTGPVGVAVTFTFKRPQKHYLRGELRIDAPRCCYPAKRGDVDKLLRSTLDALTGPVFADDAQVITVTGTVLWGDADQTEILVSEIDDVVGVWMNGVVA
jgi:crossover junction endodeoxyribonuclease RusA